MLFVCYPKCSTCAKARKWLEEQEISFEERDIKTDNPTEAELRDWLFPDPQDALLHSFL